MKTHRIIVTCAIILCCTGCVTSYKHISDPRVANDGYDWLCVGAEYKKANFTARVDGCNGIGTTTGQQTIHATLEWRPK